jgi:hypothetical protein
MNDMLTYRTFLIVMFFAGLAGAGAAAGADSATQAVWLARIGQCAVFLALFVLNYFNGTKAETPARRRRP